MEKMTYVSALNDILAMNILDDEHTEKVTALITSLNKRNTHKSDKPSKAQREKAEANAQFAEQILGLMETDTTYQAGELANMIGVSAQKMNPIVKILLEDGDIVKGEENRKGKGKVTVYSLAVDAE